MLIGDGITPGNEGRGYILRRLLRRAVRSMKLLGVEDASLPELLPVSRDAMSASYPELATDFARISAVAYAEEEAFRRTLSAGTTLFDTAVAKAKKAGTPALSGDQAFSLHDTYGFPIDVTLEMAAEQGVSVDEQGFRELMKQQRDRARADSRAKRTGSVDVLAYRRLLAEHGPTDWQAYDTLRTDSRVLAVISDLGEDDDAEVAAKGEITRVVLDRTPFYAESGGQVADAGILTWDGGRAEVLDVQRPVKGLVAHQVRVLEGELRQGAELDGRGRLRLAPQRVPGALGHPRRARRAARGARPAGAAVGLLQPAGLPAAGLRLAGGADAPAAHSTSRTSPTPPSAPTTGSRPPT